MQKSMLALASASLLGQMAVADNVVIEAGSFVRSTATDLFPFDHDTTIDAVTGLPFVLVGQSASIATASSTNDYAFLDNGVTTFDVIFQNHESSSLFASGVANADIYFTPTVDLEYTVSGYYDTVGTGDVQLLANLRDSQGNFLLQNRQLSTQATDQSFVVGEAEGGGNSYMAGSLTGILLAGETYRFEYVAEVSGAVGTITGTGAVSLDLSPLTIVPLPSAAGLAGIGLLAVGIRRRR